MKLKQSTVTSTGEMEIAPEIVYISEQMRRKILQQNKLILDLFLLLDKLFNPEELERREMAVSHFLLQSCFRRQYILLLR